MRHGLIAAYAALSLAAPLAAQEPPMASAHSAHARHNAPEVDFQFLSEEEEALADLEQEIAATFGMLSEIFKAEPLTPEQEARVPLGQEMAGHIMPEGSFAAAMNDTVAPMMTMVMGEMASDPRTRLGEISGVATEDLARLEDAAAQEALDIFDPQYALRSERLSGAMVMMIGKLLSAIEPAYREAMARALAVRFEEGEMRELLTFFGTPLGGKFAAQSFLVQYDPRMMGVMEAMGPAFIKIMPEMMQELDAIETELGSARDFTQLSGAERARAARLIGKSVSELDALVPEMTESDGAAEAVT